MSEAPSLNGPNGERGGERAAGGRFGPGNKGGPGNPHARRVHRLRSALLKAVTPHDMRAIVGKLVEGAKAGSVPAAREILERTLGKPIEPDLLERLERLEKMLNERNTV